MRHEIEARRNRFHEHRLVLPIELADPRRVFDRAGHIAEICLRGIVQEAPQRDFAGQVDYIGRHFDLALTRGIEHHLLR